MNEFELIQNLVTQQNKNFESPEIGPGDDAALVVFSQDKKVVLSKDLLVQNVHFDLSYATLQDVGWKSLAVNASDIFAMGGALTGFLVGLAMPNSMKEDMALLYQGMSEYLAESSAKIYGGDISCSKELVISVTAFGTVDSAIERSGAEVGDVIMLSGPLGNSQLGLDLLQNNQIPKVVEDKLSQDIKKKSKLLHLRPQSLASFVEMLVQNYTIHSMIDVSDGFFQDLGHILTKSKLSAHVDIDSIPTIFQRELNPEYHFKVINGGEDYQLLFTVSEKESNAILKTHPESRKVGKVVEAKNSAIYIVCDEREMELNQYLIKYNINQNIGFDHFRS